MTKKDKNGVYVPCKIIEKRKNDKKTGNINDIFNLIREFNILFYNLRRLFK
ncbi:MAG: hypothetical protein QXH95_03380 [Thermoplasmata archaeon]